jgi:hypothetical protein
MICIKPLRRRVSMSFYVDLMNSGTLQNSMREGLQELIRRCEATAASARHALDQIPESPDDTQVADAEFWRLEENHE